MKVHINKHVLELKGASNGYFMHNKGGYLVFCGSRIRRMHWSF